MSTGIIGREDDEMAWEAALTYLLHLWQRLQRLQETPIDEGLLSFLCNATYALGQRPRHEHIATYLYHQHVGNEENVQPSMAMTLEIVLRFIQAQLPETD